MGDVRIIQTKGSWDMARKILSSTIQLGNKLQGAGKQGERSALSNRTHLHVSLDIHHQQHVPLQGTITPLVIIIFMAKTVVTGIKLGAGICISFYRYYVSRQN